MSLKQAAREAYTKTVTVNIADKVEATFGPNPCTTLHLQTNDGDHLYLTCDRKRCVDCGPRKKMIIQLQMQQGFGDNAYITTYTDRIELDRALERNRKQCQRTNNERIVQCVGDSTLGWIVASNHPMQDNQRLTTLSDWYGRILYSYHHSVQRIRRSYALGRVSLVTLYRKSKSGQASPWWRRSVNSDVVEEMQDTTWSDMLAEIEWKEGVLLIHKPDVSLPIPF